MTWPELRHEGDTAYYRARVEKVVGRWTERASAPHEPGKARPPVECDIPRRDYRGVGGRYVAEVALAQGVGAAAHGRAQASAAVVVRRLPSGGRRGDRHGTRRVTAVPRLARIR
ncbi:hypothetical protein STENM223S_01373 [Streptomyces tendae]